MQHNRNLVGWVLKAVAIWEFLNSYTIIPGFGKVLDRGIYSDPYCPASPAEGPQPL
jgi:hypothetical protein